MPIYLAVATLVAFVAALLLGAGLSSAPAAEHVVFAAGVMPLVFGAMIYFVPVLTRGGDAHRAVWLAPPFLQAIGVAVVLYLAGESGRDTLDIAAVSGAAVAFAFAGWMMARARRTVGKPHPGWRWYLAAVLFLALALLAIPAMRFWPESRQALRVLHLHLNTLGFLGFAALGTLPVLLPTALNMPDPTAAGRLRRDLPIAVVAVLTIAFGAVFWRPLALGGAVLAIVPALKLGLAWQRRYRWRAITAPAAPLVAALLGYVLLLLGGVAHAQAMVEGRDAPIAFVAIFLLPLLTGALAQLLPVWRYPGKRVPARDRMHVVLGSHGTGRSLLFLGGGVLWLFGFDNGIWFAVAGMLSFTLAVFQAFTRHDSG
ncbi:MAG TPA: hypothetical protein PKZ22_04425 [Accumulibacter sp.]|jgi:hypothetical protein|nr:hypothetical protein [Accumulibacter sp.]